MGESIDLNNLKPEKEKIKTKEEKKNSREQLYDCFSKMITAMKEKGMEGDATMVQKMKDRIDRYRDAILEAKKFREEKGGKEILPEEVFDNNGLEPESRVAKNIVVAHKIGKDGGAFYHPNGFIGSGGRFQKEADLDSNRLTEKIKEVIEKSGQEKINFFFSEEGETEFYKALGVIRENETAKDITRLYQEQQKFQQIDRFKYDAEFNTNIEGVEISIRNYKPMNEAFEEKRIVLNFDNEFRKRLVEKE